MCIETASVYDSLPAPKLEMCHAVEDRAGLSAESSIATGLFRGKNAKLGPGTNRACSPLLAGSHLPTIPPYQVAGGTLGRVRARD